MNYPAASGRGIKNIIIKLKAKEITRLKAEVQDESGSLFEDQTISWGSSDPSIVNINAFEGIAKALAPNYHKDKNICSQKLFHSVFTSSPSSMG